MLSSVHGQYGGYDVLAYDYVGPIISTSIFLVIGIVVAILIYKRQKKNKISKTEKNDSKVSSIESQNDKNLINTIQERLAKGEISLEEYNSLKKEFSD